MRNINSLNFLAFLLLALLCEVYASSKACHVKPLRVSVSGDGRSENFYLTTAADVDKLQHWLSAQITFVCPAEQSNEPDSSESDSVEVDVPKKDLLTRNLHSLVVELSLLKESIDSIISEVGRIEKIGNQTETMKTAPQSGEISMRTDGESEVETTSDCARCTKFADFLKSVGGTMNSTVNLIATLADPSATRPFQDFKTVFKAGAGLYTILTEQTVLCNIATSACHDGGWAASHVKSLYDTQSLNCNLCAATLDRVLKMESAVDSVSTELQKLCFGDVACIALMRDFGANQMAKHQLRNFESRMALCTGVLRCT